MIGYTFGNERIDRLTSRGDIGIGYIIVVDYVWGDEKGEVSSQSEGKKKKKY